VNRKATHMINVALKILEIDYHLTNVLDGCKSQAEVDRIMTPFKQRVSDRRRELAKKYHPDINNGGGEKMKHINQACDFLLKLKINCIPRPPQPVHLGVTVFFFSSGGGGASRSSGGTDTSTYYY